MNSEAKDSKTHQRGADPLNGIRHELLWKFGYTVLWGVRLIAVAINVFTWHNNHGIVRKLSIYHLIYGMDKILTKDVIDIHSALVISIWKFFLKKQSKK